MTMLSPASPIAAPTQAGLDVLAARLLTLHVLPTGWSRAMAAPVEAGDPICIIGRALAGLAVGNTYEFTGSYKTHPKYGLQFDAQLALNHVPASATAIRKLLVRCFKGIGDVTASKLIAHHQQNATLSVLRDQLLNNPYAVDFSPFTTRPVEFTAQDDIPSMVQRKFALHLLGIDRLSSRVINLLAKKYTLEHADPINKAWADFAQNPYAAIRDTEGYGFLTADAIATSLGIEKTDTHRLAAMVTHALDEGCSSAGNTYLLAAELTQVLKQFDPEVNIELGLLAAQQNQEPIEMEMGRFYPKHLYIAEVRAAASLAARLRATKPMLEAPTDEVHRLIREAESVKSKAVGHDFVLDDSQRAAVHQILTSRQALHTVTAGPGCGKTAIMEILVLVLATRNAKTNTYGFCAPTGKAAKVLSTRISKIGAIARTIHATLGVTEDGFEHNAANLLGFLVMVIDESSMLDLMLMDALLQATPLDTHMIFLGDAQQLPSVGPGNCLADLLCIPADHHHLNKTHRNQGGILDVVQEAAQGRCDMRDRSDVRFIPRLPDPSDESVDGLISYFEREMERAGTDLTGICLLMPKRRGSVDTPGWNTTHLNRRMRDRFNPDGTPISGTLMREGDRIIVRKNILLKLPDNTYRQIVNGDTGFIVGTRQVGNEKAELLIELDDGTSIRLPADASSHLDWAYAMTVHSAQGSEYLRVIFLCTNGSPGFVHRGIVFTAFSRARAHLTAIAKPHTLTSVLRREQPHRNSALAERVKAATASTP